MFFSEQKKFFFFFYSMLLNMKRRELNQFSKYLKKMLFVIIDKDQM